MFSMKDEKKNIKYALYIIATLFFIICVVTSLKYGDYNLIGSYEKMDNDDVRYIRSAWTILDTGILSYHNPADKTVFIMPGISYTLAFFMKIFGRNEAVMAFRIFQGLLQTLSIFLIFFVGRKLFNSKVGLGAAIIDAFYIPEIWATNVILTETIFKFFLVLLIYISIYAIEEKDFKYYIWGGAIWGLATLYRPTIAAFPMVILFMWIHKKYKVLDMVKFGVVTALVFSTIMSPWWIRNYKVFGEFIPLTLSSGNPMVEGSYINYDESIDYYAPERSEDVIEQNKLYIENVKYRFKKVMLKRPLAYAKWYFIDKGLTLWTVAFYWKEIWGINLILVMIYHILILILGTIGMIKYLRRDRKNKNNTFRSYNSYSLGLYRVSTKSSISNGKILFFVLVFFYITHIPYITFSRYGYPTMFIFMIYANYLFLGEDQ